MPRGDGRFLPLQQPGFPVAVCWSAKSGCTTVLKWFLAQNGLLDEALAYSNWIHSYRQEKLFTSKGYVRQCEQLFKSSHQNTSIIRVIRDPASRAVSSFLHFVRYIEGDEHSPAAAFVTHWKSAVGLSGQQGLSFQQFLLYVSAQQHKGVPLDPHFRPQYDAKQDLKVDTYVRLEDLSAGLRAVEDRCGLPHVHVGQLSISPHHNPATAQHAWPTNAAAFPADHTTFDECGTPPAQAFLDPETRMLIRTAYWTDYEAYGHHYDAAPAITRRIPGTDRETMAQDLHKTSWRAA
jgi:hypothetical protein